MAGAGSFAPGAYTRQGAEEGRLKKERLHYTLPGLEPNATHAENRTP
jgi:hypothetical protein